MDPITLAAIGGVAGAARGVGSGLSTAIGGTAYFTKDDEKRRNYLRRLQQTGQMGLSDVEKQRIQSEQAVERGGMLRTQQSQSAMAAQALANQQALSGREMFLASLAGQDAEANLRGQQAQAMAQQDMQARQQQQEQLARLNEQERMRKAAVRSGLTQALTAGIMGGATGALEEKIAADRAQRFEDSRRAEESRIHYGRTTGGLQANTWEQGIISNVYATNRYGF